MKSVLIAVLIHSLLVHGLPRPKRLVKRAANLNPGFNLEAFRQDQLDLHNHYRQLHGVSLMTKDDTMTQEAQDYAEYLAEKNLFQHCGRGESCNPGGAGENLAYAGGHMSVETNATLRWYEEVYDYNYCTWPQGRATTRPGREGKMVGHFTQIVWTTSVRLGIGYARNFDRTKVYVVARYSPPGNFIGQYDNNVPKASYLLDTFQDNCNGIYGGLTAWSEPGPCTKPCGKGVRFETRSCTNPKPSFNGRDCSGETKRLYPYWCNSQTCTTEVNERNEQCRQRGYLPQANNFRGSNECNLHCRQSLENTLYIARGQVDDGTLCKDKSGACINGACILLQNEPESPATTKPPATTTKPPATTTPPQTTQSIPMTTEMDKTPTAAPPTTSFLTPSDSSLPPTTQPGPKETTTKATTAPPATTKATTTKTVTQTPSVTSGGYSEWSQPGPCSKPCGGGIRFRTRTCLTPGGGCIGPSRELYKIWCNPQPCSPRKQERNMQCEARGHLPEAHNFGGADECNLYCRSTQSGQRLFYYRGSVDDGTHCNKDTGACMDNVCVPMSFEPGMEIEGEYKEVPTGSYWNDVIVTIPNGAKNVQIIHNGLSTFAGMEF
ncbi:Golgi-associated plant pathogenesis-related 1-like [Paramuricea clavata]|uniref:Golgi-associated plant pathogenesis-related 1-like n=1 Tax=Paramuricea clavata TaxID=317549 RepID=A0A7D9LMJ7_PARCT|nr:Golgi-associated plant pathogenesis-related 1-like [Paramuricea clavata]